MTDASFFDFSRLGVSEAYHFLTSAIVPRPIAFISTLNTDKSVNLAPFSFFNGVCSDPPCLSVSIARKADGGKKDTLLNIERTGEFAVNSTHEWLAERINQTSAELPYGESEMVQQGFHALPSRLISVPRIAESWVQFECRVEKLVEVGSGGAGSATLVIGRILGVHVDPRAVNDKGRVDFTRLKPLARLGGRQWVKAGEVIEMVRPD